MVGGAVMEYVYDADRPGFLKRELMGFGVDGYQNVRVHDCTNGLVTIHIFREHLTCFSNVKSIKFGTLQLVY